MQSAEASWSVTVRLKAQIEGTERLCCILPGHVLTALQPSIL